MTGKGILNRRSTLVDFKDVGEGVFTQRWGTKNEFFHECPEHTFTSHKNGQTTIIRMNIINVVEGQAMECSKCLKQWSNETRDFLLLAERIGSLSGD